jgi:TonB family protein
MTPAPAVRPALSPEFFVAPAIAIKDRLDQILRERFASRRYWIPGVAVVALLLIFLVARFSWRNPAPGMAASRPPAPAVNAVGSNSITPLNPASAKPPSGIATVRSERARTSGAVQNAAQIETVENTAGPTDSSANSSSPTQPAQSTVPSTTVSSTSEPPPAVVVAAAEVPSNLPGLTSAPVSLPKLEARVSDITQATLIHKVDPTYPPQARTQRLAGSVVLDTTIAENGSVHDITVVSGPPLLAEAATRAVRQWRYSPLLLNGTPIAVQKRITVVFTLP